MKIKSGLITAVLSMAVLLVSGISGKASAALITFEGQANTIYEAPITRAGFDIGNPMGQEQHFHEIVPDENLYGALPANGTGVLLNDRDTEIFVRANSGSGFTSFNLGLFDVAASLDHRAAYGITITGYLNNVLTGTITLDKLGYDYTTLNGSSLGEVDLLLFDGIDRDGGFIIDNLNVTATGTQPVPLPAAIWFLGSGLLGIFGVSRKRTK